MLTRALLAISLTSAAAAQTQILPQQWYRTFSHTNPVLRRIRAGDVVITKTVDSGGVNEKGDQVTPGSNPLTGPFFVEGAEPGDSLRVHLRRVRLNRNWGST